MATRKLSLPKAPPSAAPVNANIKPKNGPKPKAQNTVGAVVPKTQPNRTTGSRNPTVKAETPEEGGLLQKAGELLEKGEIQVLNNAKDAVSGGIDGLINAAGGGVVASTVGTIAKGAVEVLFPTNIIDLVPGGKILSGGRKAVKLGEKVLTKAGKEAGTETAKKKAKKEAQQAAGGGGGRSDGKGKKKNKNPCDHPNDKTKKRKYVVYKADEYDKKTGKYIGTYVGRTSGQPGEETKAILKRRQSGHHRNVKNMEAVFDTESYAAVRGAEQIVRDKASTVKQINPISPKNKRKDDYMDCAESKGAK